ncbi:MAG: hypothetical protein IPN50_09060 [Sphingomonadales bacterium]|nr:hypothetical protein [Sphingomonadales bacterium]
MQRFAPGATCTLTGTYVVQQSDVDAGKIDNTASVASTQVTTPVTDSVSTPIAAAPALTSTSRRPPAASPSARPLTYTVVATNAGNITQSAVTVSDPMLTPGSTTCATLAPGATCTLTGTYVLTPADVNSGALNNTASVSSTQVTTPVTDSVSTPLVPAPIAAVDDSATGVNGTTGAPNVLNVLGGDTLNAAPATTAGVTIVVASGSSVPAGLTVRSGNGQCLGQPEHPCWYLPASTTPSAKPRPRSTSTGHRKCDAVDAAPITATPDTATGINGATGGNDVVNAYTATTR